MLNGFPAPYPDEWWYSVLCRYFVRAGYQSHAAVSAELYGKERVVHGSLLPGRSCYLITSRLPQGSLDLEDVLMNHTLMPYYLRFYPAEKKQNVLKKMLQGSSTGITSIDIHGPDGEQGLKYCPICYMEDMEKYGEPYWHREHQIPLMQLCPAHRAPLVKYPIQYTKLSDVYIPLASIACEKATARDIRPWEFQLTDVLMDFLTFPYGYSPEPGVNALETALHKMGLEEDRFQKNVSLSIEKIYNAISAYYGEEISRRYFSKLSHATIHKLCNWTVTSPERYALLSVLVGLSASELFTVREEYEDPALACLKKYQASGVLYRKSELADLIGISPARLNSLARKYGIAPFWKQCKTTGARRTHCVRIMLSPEEKSLLYRAVKASGNGQTAVFARTVVLDKAVEIIEKNKKNEPY